MAEKDNTKGVKTTKKAPVVKMLPFRAENKRISKAKFIDNRKRDKAAQAAADIAYDKEMAKSGKDEGNVDAEKDLEDTQRRVADVKAKMKEVVAELGSDPDNRSLKMKKGKLSKQLDDAENHLDELENK